MKYPVPYFSQFDDVVRDDWKPRACSIVCVAMVLNYFPSETKPRPSIDELIDEGVQIMGFTNLGWSQEAITFLFHNHGLLAYREEFRSIDVDTKTGIFTQSRHAERLMQKGIQRIADHLTVGGLVMASTFRDWDPKKSLHAVLLIGVEREGGKITGFYFHDPDTEQERRNDKFIPIDEFIKNWRKMAIFIEKLEV